MEMGNGGASGDASWKKIVVAIILDGIEPADKAALESVKLPQALLRFRLITFLRLLIASSPRKAFIKIQS